ncbi:MAG: methylenetetrahydrofolate reductase [NAD(P)H] [Nocardioidaceae bacterium]|nr:MAG: methylenetetrahydrofolate reductase [NAD(P)H] [Nocardioidaceae bacterium]
MAATAFRIPDAFASGARTFSFEFFPPKDAEGRRLLWRTLRELEPLQPSFVSVTYGAGGSTRDLTVAITERIAIQTSMSPMAHLTCVGHTRDELRRVIGSLAAAGVRNVLALRGDPPGGPTAPWEPVEGGLSYASELVALTRSLGDFAVGVGVSPSGHRASLSLEHDAQVLKQKQDAGAEFAITDMFFDSDQYFALVERARAAGVTIPLVPGIMPITNIGQIERMAEFTGAPVPDQVVKRVVRFEGDPKAVRAEGILVATELCDQLLAGGAPGLHFFTLNRSKATREIYQGLQVTA